MPHAKYKRILIKISGEQLAGKFDFGVDPDMAHYLALEIKKVVKLGVDIVIIVGGGNMVRGAQIARKGIKRVTADQMGMLSGLINSMILTDIFESEGLKVRCLSNVFADQIAEPYSYRRAIKHLESGRVVIIAGGTARPYFSHDTAAVSFALELDADLVLKATKVDGVFDKDPKKYKDAQKLDSITFEQALSNSKIAVMDKAALGLAMEQNKPIIVFNPLEKDNILNVLLRGDVGTLIN